MLVVFVLLIFETAHTGKMIDYACLTISTTTDLVKKHSPTQVGWNIDFVLIFFFCYSLYAA